MGTKKNPAPVNVRLEAVRTLHAIYGEGAYANLALQQTLQRVSMTDQDRRFFTELVYGVLRHHSHIDAMIAHLTKRPVRKLSLWVACILRLGIYQLEWMDGVPARAAIHESVTLAKKLSPGLSGLVNGVLRNVQRAEGALTPEALGKTPAEVMALTYNQPTWLVSQWLETYGAERTEALCRYYNTIPPLEGRLNTLRGSLEDLQDALTFMNVDWAPIAAFPEGVQIQSHTGRLQDTPWVRQGLVAFMDAGSLAIAHAVDPQPGDKVLDVCAAPGSKTFHMAALMENTGCIVAGDIHPHKVALLEEGAKRLGATIVEPVVRDATAVDPAAKEQFDRVLVDAPCSGLGILQKKLDMRWRKQESDLATFPPLQQAILAQAAEAVRPGGILVYSTCTLRREENEDVVEAFLAAHPDFERAEMPASVPYPSEAGCVTLFPPDTQTDGFFMARLRKRV